MEVFYVIAFYLSFSLFAAIGFPIVRRFIASNTLAYALAKPLGLIIFAYAVWVLGSLHILNYQSKGLITGAYVILVAVGLYFSYRAVKTKDSDEKPGKKKTEPTLPWYQRILIVEALSIVVYVAYLLLRSHQPEINGTERIMDMALMSSAGKTDYFPFLDAWYAGKTVNYYYYGSYLMSLISNLARVPFATGYNLALGLLFSQSVILSGAIVFVKTRSKMFAVVAAFLVTAAGTLFFAGCSINAGFEKGTIGCSYASSTRLFSPSYIINEIPSYSFTVGDLHAHVTALPFFLMTLGLLYAFAINKRRYDILALLGLSFATLGMINLWDMITAVCLFGVLVIIKVVQDLDDQAKRKAWDVIKPWAKVTALVGIIAAVLYFPYYRNFESPVLGIYFIPKYISLHKLKDVQWPTPPIALLGMWGAFGLTIVTFFWLNRKEWREYLYPIGLTIVSLGIIIGVDLFFVQDIYGIANPPYFRANTTFKFGYHAWTMLSIVFCVVAASLWHKHPQEKRTFMHRWIWWVVFVVVAAGAFYPVQAVDQFYLSSTSERTLDGSAWIGPKMGEDREIINYINDNFKQRVVIAEAVGDSYSQYSRIASFTGMITPMGWKTHEWTWRFDAKAAKRAVAAGNVAAGVETGWGAVAAIDGQIRNLYETSEARVAKDIINLYGIKYVYVGDLERTTYKELKPEKFYEIARPIFQSGDSILFEIK